MPRLPGGRSWESLGEGVKGSGRRVVGTPGIVVGPPEWREGPPGNVYATLPGEMPPLLIPFPFPLP